jgi:hypothetical protein
MTTSRTRKGRTATHAPTAQNPLQFCIEFVLDETGSMARVQKQTVAGFNEFLSEQKTAPGDCRLSLTKFEGGAIRCSIQSVNIGLIPDMSLKTFCPGGGTNLYDAIGDRIEALQDRLRSWAIQPNVLFVVMTDGEDNQSRYFDQNMIFKLITQNRETGWTFAYMGAGQNAARIGLDMGFRDSEITCFEQANIENVFRDFSAATTVYRTAMSATATNVSHTAATASR